MFNYLVSMPLSKSILRMNLFIFLIRKTSHKPGMIKEMIIKNVPQCIKFFSKPINIKEVIKNLSNKCSL